MTKPAAIEACRQLFNSETYEIIDITTRARLSWKNFPVLDNSIPKDIINIIGEKYFERGYNMINSILNKIQSERLQDSY